MTQHIHYIFHAFRCAVRDIRKTAVSGLLVMAAVVALSSCSADEAGGDTMVTITVAAPPSAASPTVSAAKSGALTRAITAADEGKIQDLLVLIFNDKDEIIGYTYGSYSLGSDGKVSVNVNTRKATGCTVYVVANAGTTSGMGNFASVRTKSDFDDLYAQLSSPADLGNGSSLLMFGSRSGYDTSKSGTVTLNRLSAKTELSIVVGSGITLDSYQLCHAPLSAYYVDNKTTGTASPKDYGVFPVVSSSATATTVNATYYLYESLVGKGSNTNSDGWKGRYKANAPANATYLVIKAHTASWKSTYYVYLGGKTLSSATNTSYDYTDYTIYRNTDYKVTVTLSGSGSAEEGLRVNYAAKEYVGGDTKLNAWQDETTTIASGMEFVDLGLSVKWATCNLGATKPEEYGKYYAWADTKGYASDESHDFSWANVRYCKDTSSPTSSSSWSKYTSGNATLESSDDAATVNLGGSWRMPNHDEWQELYKKCTWTWTSKNGINGYEVSASNGKSIFLPAAGFRDGSSPNYVSSRGYFWSSQVSSSSVGHAWNMYFDSDSHDPNSYGNYRCSGLPIRPVCP
ncbi:DUF4906 domain-containing protein [Hallella absiana]|uniref:DUF4906 domain-containing protein n=1 Tax=Hallella absiana TaxID=2925336 RepID=UPI0021C5F478|nr:fimbrial protein [Hallella absiana]